MTVGKDPGGEPRPVDAADRDNACFAEDGNTLACPSMPQVDIFSKGIDLFITHGGQNSFVESTTLQTPMLVVPTVGDQIDNAEKAVQVGMGEKVGRPPPQRTDDQDIKEVATRYRQEVKDKILHMLDAANYPKYKEAVISESSKYRGGGVPEAVKILEAL